MMVENIFSVVKKPNLIGDFYLTEKNDSVIAEKDFGSKWCKNPVIKKPNFQLDTITIIHFT